MTKSISCYARKTASKLAVLFILFGTSIFWSPSAQAASSGMVQVTCATSTGQQRTNGVSWDNSNQFFMGKGNIAQFYCEGGYAGGDYRIFVSANIADSSLLYYNGVTPTPAPSPTPTSVETQTASPSPSPDGSTVEATPSPTPSPSPSPETQTASATPQDTATVPAHVAPETATPVLETSTAVSPVDTSTVQSQPTETPASPTPSIPETPPAVEPTPAPVSEPVSQPEPTPTPVPDPIPLPVVNPEPTPEAVVDPAPDPEPIPIEVPEPDVEPEPESVPEPEPEPEPETPVEPAPEVKPLVPEKEPVVDEVDSFEPPIVILSDSTNLSALPPDTPVKLANGVVITAEVAIAVELLQNPAELLGTLLTNPVAALQALTNVGADLPPEVREKAEDVIVSAVIAGNIATQAAASAAAAASYRRKP